MRRAALSASAALALALGGAAPASAQAAVYGRVLTIQEGQSLAGADVALLDRSGSAVVARAVSDSAGTFSLEGAPPGSYLLVASLSGFVSTAPREVELGDAARERVDLELVPLDVLTERTRSVQRLGESAERACRDQVSARTSAVMGVVRDSLAGVTLSGVTVVLEQVTDDGRLRAVREARTDGDGFFAFCPLPAPREVAVRAEMGERSATMGVETEPGTGTFLNLHVGLATEREPSAVAGVVKDWETGEPLPGSRVVLQDLGRVATTDAQGRFSFPDVPYGVYVVEVEHLGYSTAREAFYLNGGATANVDVSLTVRAMEVDPIVVTVEQREHIFGDLADLDRRAELGLGIILRREDLEQRGLGGAMPLHTALRGLPSVQVEREGLYGYGVYLRSAFSLTGGACQPVLWVDGQRYQLDPDVGWAETVGAIEAIEIYRGAAEVPAEFSGSDAACGVVVVWTQRGR